jgi:hypothetical protein
MPDGVSDAMQTAHANQFFAAHQSENPFLLGTAGISVLMAS